MDTFRVVKRRKNPNKPRRAEPHKRLRLTSDFTLFSQTEGLKMGAIAKKHLSPIPETSSSSSPLSIATEIHRARIRKEGKERIRKSTVFFRPQQFSFWGFQYKGRNGFIGNQKLMAITTEIEASTNASSTKEVNIIPKIQRPFVVVFDANSHFDVSFGVEIYRYLDGLDGKDVIDREAWDALGLGD